MFVIPMLGHSSRFFKAGYTKPKYRLPLWDGTVFDAVLHSFKDYFETDLFVLICRKDFNDADLLRARLEDLGVKAFRIIEHAQDTRGQAESVELAIEEVAGDEELFIFNIDTILHAFRKADARKDSAGYLEVFRGEGEHWSFVGPAEGTDQIAARVVEKERISDLCSNGLYYFRTVGTFKTALQSYCEEAWDGKSELYVAPLYSELIKRGETVRYEIIDIEDIGFCGVPDEYQALLKQRAPDR